MCGSKRKISIQEPGNKANFIITESMCIVTRITYREFSHVKKRRCRNKKRSSNQFNEVFLHSAKTFLFVSKSRKQENQVNVLINKRDKTFFHLSSPNLPPPSEMNVVEGLKNIYKAISFNVEEATKCFSINHPSRFLFPSLPPAISWNIRFSSIDTRKSSRRACRINFHKVFKDSNKFY